MGPTRYPEEFQRASERHAFGLTIFVADHVDVIEVKRVLSRDPAVVALRRAGPTARTNNRPNRSTPKGRVDGAENLATVWQLNAANAPDCLEMVDRRDAMARTIGQRRAPRTIRTTFAPLKPAVQSPLTSIVHDLDGGAHCEMHRVDLPRRRRR
jgi:hypothetical protein